MTTIFHIEAFFFSAVQQSNLDYCKPLNFINCQQKENTSHQNSFPFQGAISTQIALSEDAMCAKSPCSNDTFKIQYLAGSVNLNEENTSHRMEISLFNTLKYLIQIPLNLKIKNIKFKLLKYLSTSSVKEFNRVQNQMKSNHKRVKTKVVIFSSVKHWT